MTAIPPALADAVDNDLPLLVERCVRNGEAGLEDLEGLPRIVTVAIAWLIGVPWSDAIDVGNFIGQKTILNEFVGYTSLSEKLTAHSDKSIMLSSFALAGFATISSIGIQIGALGGVVAPMQESQPLSVSPGLALIVFFRQLVNELVRELVVRKNRVEHALMVRLVLIGVAG